MLCTRCSDIDLTSGSNGYRYALLDSQDMLQSSEAGCEGCKIFLRWAEVRFGKALSESDPSPPGLLVQLRRYGAEDTRVDLEFLEGRGSPKLRGSIALRLCSAYGMEASLQATYKRKDEFYNGRLVSENLVVDGISLGRLISRDSGDTDCLDLAAAWMERCSQQHDHCAEQKDVRLPTRLVHIPNEENRDLSLRDTGKQTGRYVALSHCWGSGIAFKTTRATLSARKEGFSSEILARNFQDAVHITRRLGFKYLWIDALCIVQDSLDDWARESSEMAQVYGNASLTIGADLAPHSDFGILHPRNFVTSHKFGLHNDLCLQTLGIGWAAIPDMPLTQRGWAFQERILSSRILHFLEEQIAWECDTTVYLENSHARQLGHSAHFSKHNLTHVIKRPFDPNKRSTSLSVAETSSSERTSLHLVEPSNRVMSLEVRLGQWNMCISELAVRHFTNTSDKLPSLSGLASAMEVTEFGKYLAGVWESDPFLSMAWFARWPQAPQKYRAPSWSWAATMWQVIWYKSWEHEPTPAEKSAWDNWNSRFAPKLLSHHIINANVDLKGEVLEGTYIIVHGFCRDVYIREVKESSFNEWEWIGENIRQPGRKVHMDSRGGTFHRSWDSKAYFNEDLENLDQGIDKADLKSFICLQIVRECGRDYPKIITLILRPVSGTENSFIRVGLLVFDDPSADSQSAEWKAQALKLI